MPPGRPVAKKGILATQDASFLPFGRRYSLLTNAGILYKMIEKL